MESFSGFPVNLQPLDSQERPYQKTNMKYDYDIIVVGGGPAGTSTALFAQRMGLNVLLLDKKSFPRDKVCGDLVPLQSVIHLKELGLFERIQNAAHVPIDGVRFHSPNGKSLKFKLSPDRVCDYALGFNATRKVFDNILFQAAKERGAVIENFRVRDLLMKNHRVFGVTGETNYSQKRTITAKVVVGADGFHSVVARKTGAYHYSPKHCLVATRGYYRGVKGLDHSIELGFLKQLHPGYFWIFPVGNGIANVGLGTTHQISKKYRVKLRALQEWLTTASPLCHRFADAELIGEVKGWNLPTPDKHRRVQGKGFVLVGDAAGLVNPLTGGGIDNAIISGHVAARVLAEACQGKKYDAAGLQKYEPRLWEALDKAGLKSDFRLQRVGHFRLFYVLLERLITRASDQPEVINLISSMVMDGKSMSHPRFLWPLLKLLF